mmetsp:Transcript_25923/g.40247  ORF Transcript_25923/g.40247 Transcript_25923/m.40247 type:complete len:98 (-) Transcript_25923:49-342(-)
MCRFRGAGVRTREEMVAEVQAAEANATNHPVSVNAVLMTNLVIIGEVEETTRLTEEEIKVEIGKGVETEMQLKQVKDLTAAVVVIVLAGGAEEVDEE